MVLLRQRLKQPGRWAALAPYWRSLPPGDALYCKELALPHHAAELQDAALARPCLAVKPACKPAQQR